MKIIKAFTFALLVILVVFCSIYTAFAAVYIEDWGYRFEKVSNGSAYEINKYIGEDTVVTIPDRYNGFRITSVGEYAFTDTSITSVSLGKNITEIKNNAFINVTTLTSVELNDSLTSIGSLAFAGCTGLSELIIPASVNTIADDAFDNCNELMIKCYTDSFAHQYAEANDIEYVLLDAPVEVTFILGDADGDEVVSVLDATKVQRVLAALDSDEDGKIALRGDVNGDSLTILDATAIQRWIADYEVNDPIGTEVTRIISPSSQN